MFKRSKDRRALFQPPLPLSWTTVGVPFSMHTRRSVYKHVFDISWFLGEICFCSLSQVPCYTPCFQADLTQNLARMDLTSLIEMEPTSVTSWIICYGGAYRSWWRDHSQRAAGRSQILSGWRNDKRAGTNAISRFNPGCSSTVQGFSDSLVQSGADFDELVEEYTGLFLQRWAFVVPSFQKWLVFFQLSLLLWLQRTNSYSDQEWK